MTWLYERIIVFVDALLASIAVLGVLALAVGCFA